MTILMAIMTETIMIMTMTINNNDNNGKRDNTGNSYYNDNNCSDNADDECQ